MLLSKALRMQQDLKDKKNEIIIEGLESKIKDYEPSLEKKDFLLQATEGSLAVIQAEGGKNTKLHKSLKDLRNTCLDFGNRCVQRLKGVFCSVGASYEDIAPSSEDTSNTFKHIENKVDALNEVIAGHGDLCALLASRGTTGAFLKVGCTHAKTVNRPTFTLSPSDLIDIPSEARSIGNRFITQI
jgi:UDP-N-acetylglucosamine pyrophosphorylase